MAFCEFCKAEGQKTGTCAYCGTVYYTAGVTFIYGQTEKESYGSEFRLTDKYLIVRSVSNGEMLGNVTAGAAFGLIGALAATAVDAARKKNYGFYDLHDLQKVIYPYHTKSLKKDTAFKFVNKDGTDFVLNFNLNGMFSGKAAKNFADILVKNGIFVEDGSRTNYEACCMKPFVNKDTFGTRVCQSAATFVRMTEQQFIVPPMDEAATVQQPTYTQTAQQPVYQTPVQPAVQTTVHEQSVSSVNASAWQSAWNTPVSATPAAEEKVNQIMCYTCGAMNNEGVRFCSKCGTQLQSEPEGPAASPIDDWKNKW